MTDDTKQSINIETFCQLTETETESLKQLFGECYTRVFPTGSSSLSKIMVVEDGMIENVVNRLIAETGVDGYYKREGSSAVAVPLYYQGQFYSIIIFSKSEIPNNIEEFAFPNVSTFLEELLHVKLYEELQGYVQFHPKDSVEVIARKTIDEYVVNRRKYSILVDMFGSLGYNEKLMPEFNNLDERLFVLISNAAAKFITVDEACKELFEIIYREFLELLSRYLSVFDSINGIPEIQVNKYPFLNDVAYKYWKLVDIELKKCFDNVENFDKYAKAITDIITDFLREIGVTYKEIPNGFYFYFDNSFLLQYRYKRYILRS